MTATAFITVFGDALRVAHEVNGLRGVVLESPNDDVLGLDRERNCIVNALPGLQLLQMRPQTFVLCDSAAIPYSHAPDGTTDQTLQQPGWIELACLMLDRFPSIPPASIGFAPIPHLLHFICNDKSTLDAQLIENVNRTISNNPGWIVHLWDEADRFRFISDHYGWEVLKVYLMIGNDYGASKADFFRYLVMYKLGGVYLDIKSTSALPLNEIIRPDDEYLLSQWNMSGSGLHQGWGLGSSISHVPGGEYQQWFIIARPGHPYLRRVINLVMTKILTYRPHAHGVGTVTTLNITGPHAYTKAIFPILDQHAHRIFDAEMTGLIYSTVENHRQLIGSTYHGARTPLVTGNDSYLY